MRAKEMVKDPEFTIEKAITQIGADFKVVCEQRKAKTADQMVAPYLESYQKWQSFAKGRKLPDIDALTTWTKLFPTAAGLPDAGWDAVCKATREYRTGVLKAAAEANQPLRRVEKPKPDDHRAQAILKAGGADLIVT